MTVHNVKVIYAKTLINNIINNTIFIGIFFKFFVYLLTIYFYFNTLF